MARNYVQITVGCTNSEMKIFVSKHGYWWLICLSCSFILQANYPEITIHLDT